MNSDLDWFLFSCCRFWPFSAFRYHSFGLIGRPGLYCWLLGSAHSWRGAIRYLWQRCTVNIAPLSLTLKIQERLHPIQKRQHILSELLKLLVYNKLTAIAVGQLWSKVQYHLPQAIQNVKLQTIVKVRA